MRNLALSLVVLAATCRKPLGATPSKTTVKVQLKEFKVLPEPSLGKALVCLVQGDEHGQGRTRVRRAEDEGRAREAPGQVGEGR